MRAVFLDRDGTISTGVPKYERVDSVDKVEILPHVMEALEKLAKLDYGVFLVTNQSGIAEGLITEADFEVINDKVLSLIAPTGIKILQTYMCPHGVDATCTCRKPNPTLLRDAAAKYDIDLPNSYMVGDRLTDVHTGRNAGTKTILVLSGEQVESPEATFTAQNLLEAVDYIAAQ